MRIAICDDEKHILNLLEQKTRSVLADENEDAAISLFLSGEDLLAVYEKQENPFDILFLDIKMNQLDGVKTAELIRMHDSRVLIVFITSSAEYVFRGYEVKAFRYLMKNELDFGFSKVLRDTMAELRYSGEKLFTFQFGAETISLEASRIYYFESSKRVVRIALSGDSYKTYAKLDEIENTLNCEDFIRCHQSYLVNAKKITRLTASEIEMKNGDVIPVSKKYRQRVGDAYLWAMR